jgi:vanillate monooxygenase ferredoxin subunit
MTTMSPTLTVRVSRKTALTPQICQLLLQAPEGGDLPHFSAGAHIDLHLPGGQVRSYSLCNPPAPGAAAPTVYELGVLHDAASRGGSRAVHTLLNEGDLLQISAPRNLFELAPEAPHHLLLAGGIGITPLLAMARALHDRGETFTLHHASRSRAMTPFVASILASPWAAQAHWHHDDDASSALDMTATLRAAPAGSHLYVCGPRGFMDAVLGAAQAAGWDAARLHQEHFGAAPAAQSGDAPFEVELARSGKVVMVEAHRSIAQALDAAGVYLPTSCEQGVCGTCLTRVIAGTPAHRDQYLTPEEQAANDQCLPCCARALSPRLVLDL